MEIQDDGQGGDQLEGSGIRGMRERVESLGGTFERKIGQGTTLVIQFPLAVNTSGSPVNPTVSKTSRSTVRVVIAEDQGMVLGALAALLEIEGDISVIARARNGKEAVQAVIHTSRTSSLLILKCLR